MFTPPVDFPPANDTTEAKPAHFVLRGRRILWILEVVRCVPVAVEDGEGIVTASVNWQRSKFNSSRRVTARDQQFLGRAMTPRIERRVTLIKTRK